MAGLPRIAIQTTGDDKTGPIAATYLPLTSCPSSCVRRYLGGPAGCYAARGRIGAYVEPRIALAWGHLDPLALARIEAGQIDGLASCCPLRVHVSGDCSTRGTARITGRAMVRYERRGVAGPVASRAWSYTHSLHVPLSAWAGASIVASVESPADLQRARASGYLGYALPVEVGARGRVKVWGVEAIVCPAQFYKPNGDRAVQCASCLICWRAGRGEGPSVAFQPEGSIRRGKGGAK